MIQKLDIFGSQILLRFKGEHTYNTRFGSLFTLLIFSIIGFRLFFIVKDIFLRNSPQVILSDRQVDDPALFEMTNYTFPMAFAMQDPKTFNAYIDESIYVIKAYQQIKRLVFNQTTNAYDSVWDAPIQLKVQPCSTLNFGNPANQNYYLKLKYENYYCFDPSAVLKIQGDFNSQVYSQVRFIVQKCQKNCKPQDVIDKFLLKATFGLQMADAYVDPTKKDNPFVSYSRDLFWPTSTLMPKDVNIYLRNSYVYSDFGWVLSDVKEQKFPTFSYYEAAVYPQDYQTYFLQVLFRFEKQKESVYYRYYKNLNNIISEIGGFTQSLLAIGILICSRVSQLQLNQEIINQAFNYEEEIEPECIRGEKIQLQCPVKEQSSPNIVNIQNDQIEAGDNTNAQKILLTSRLQMQKIGNSRLMAQNKNDNTVSMNETKKDADIYSISFNQDVTQNFNAFNSNYKFQQPASLQSGILQHKQLFNAPTKNPPNVVEAANVQEQPSPLKKEHQQILNLLLMEDSSEQDIDKETKLERSTSKELKIHKQKKKIIKQEQKLKEDRFKELMEKQTKSMRMSIWEYIKSSVWPFGELKKKKQIINYSIDKLYYNLDIFNIVKRLIEVEKLKRLLLDQDQIKLFDYLPKPTIHSDCVLKKDMKESLSKKYEVDIMYQDNRTEMQKVKDAFQSYKKIINKHEHSKLDQKLIDLLDPNLLFLFQTQQNQQIEAEIQKTKKPDSPLQIDEIQSNRQSPNQQIFEQDLSTLRNEIKLLKQALSSPRLDLQQQPILSIQSDNNMEMVNLENIQQKYSNYPSNIQLNSSIKKDEQQIQEQSLCSEVAIEDIQNQPNQFVVSNKNSEIQFKVDS